MFFNQAKIREFHYSPRFYKPEVAEKKGEDNKRRIKFRRIITRKVAPKRSIWGMLVIIIILVLLIRYLSSVIKSEKKEFQCENLQMEIIE